jgi:Uroporphyrinogen-III decarboxylase
MATNMKQWVSNCLNEPQRKLLPIMTYPGLELISKKVIDLATSGEYQFECIKALASRYPSCASVTVMDLSVEAEAFGAEIVFTENEVPTISQRLINEMSEVVALEVPKVGAARTAECLKAASLAAQQISDRPVFGGIIGPYSLAGRLVDITEFMTQIFMDPENSHLLLSKCTEFLKEYAFAMKRTGIQGIIIAEPAAGLLSPDLCQEYSSAYVKQIVDCVQDDDFVVILHNCGQTETLVDSMVSTGAGALHFGNAVKMKDVIAQIPENILAMGNLDPAGLIRNSTADEVYQKAKDLLEEMKPYKNFVLSSGCDIPPFTPKENIEAMFKALEEFNH